MNAYNKGTRSIYAIRSKTTGRVYVGCSCNVESRIRSHLLELKRGEKHVSNPKTKAAEPTQWQRDYDTYGLEDFEYYILETDVPFEQRLSVENKWISEYKAFDPQYGYNTRFVGPTMGDIHFSIGVPPKPERRGDADA